VVKKTNDNYVKKTDINEYEISGRIIDPIEYES